MRYLKLCQIITKLSYTFNLHTTSSNGCHPKQFFSVITTNLPHEMNMKAYDKLSKHLMCPTMGVALNQLWKTCLKCESMVGKINYALEQSLIQPPNKIMAYPQQVLHIPKWDGPQAIALQVLVLVSYLGPMGPTTK